MKIVFASNNPGKVLELNSLLKETGLTVIPQSDLGVSEIPETGLTFVENAILKARHASQQTGLPAIADDSGLEVDALQSGPGIYSARYAGPKAPSEENIKKLLAELAAFKQDQRRANFYCVLVFMKHANDPTPIICEGKWDGYIAETPSGVKGFGYDPVFYVPSEQCTASELSLQKKNSLSHRGKALRCLLDKLKGELCTH